MATQQNLVQNQVLGRGKVFFSKFVDGTQTPEGYRYIGNTPSFGIAMSSENLVHWSSDEGIKEKDRSITLSVDATGTFVCDDINSENLAIYLLGSASTLTQTSATAATWTLTDALKGLTYQIGRTTALPTGVRSLSSVTVVKGGTTYVVNTDYTIDLELGLITILAAGAITNGDDLVITFDRAAKTRSQVVSGNDKVEGALLFVAYNPQGDKRDFLMPYVRLSPNGEFALKGDDWQNQSFNCEILKPDGGLERIYADGRPI